MEQRLKDLPPGSHGEVIGYSLPTGVQGPSLGYGANEGNAVYQCCG